MDYILIKNENGYEEFVASKSVFWNEKEIVISEQIPFVWNKIDEKSEYIYLKGEGVMLESQNITSIADVNADIQIVGCPVRMILDANRLMVEPVIEKIGIVIYYNECAYCITDAVEFEIAEGDTLLFDCTKIIFFKNEICLIMNQNNFQTKLLVKPQNQVAFEHFPNYRRSPRLIKRVRQNVITINKPPVKKEMGKNSILQVILPSLGMLCITIAVSILLKRGMYILISAASTVMTMIISISKYLSEKKECKVTNIHREEIYEKYLLEKREELNRVKKEEEEAFCYNYPSLQEIEQIVQDYSGRIYERSANDNDFLSVSLGYHEDQITSKIEFQENEFSLDKDSLMEEAEIVKKSFLKIKKKPVIVELKNAHLGIVGDKTNIHEQLKLLVAQMTCFQSYHDLQFVSIFEDQYRDDFAWMRWYPHFRIEAINAYGTIYSEQMRDQILGSMNQILKDRKVKRDESKKDIAFSPHYVFVIDEPKLIMDHSIMEYLDMEGTELGFSIIYTTHLRENLPENIGTILIADNSEQGTLLIDHKVMVNRKINLNHTDDVNLEKMARNLSVLVHEQGMISKIPESITFFELYKVEKPEELAIKHKWEKNNSHKSLAVPLGVRATDDYVYLNLHEKAHGPHGLVAGTTGSGKSEIIQSYILSLAVNFHPYEVGFLLIDYKGGGMASLFKNLPHLLGTITNLDGSESMRAMASIKSELARRQRIFNEFEVNHINGYNQLFKSGKASEPMPHLFIISDEFAELKKEQPEFMTELVSAARIGRSLGVHLILATQKPTGVVDDQIWTNSKFKLALKVQDEADSREIIKTGDAANITQAGRAYLQVGNNEIYELFQSAWSGASFIEENEELQVDDRVYLINEIGQGELINQDLSGTIETNQIHKTQLDVTIDHIKEIYEIEQPISVKRPWLPPLPIQLVSPCLDNMQQDNDINLNVALGMIDIPEEQRQCEYILNLQKEGNLAYIASSGYGKSVILSTMLLSLAAMNTVQNLNFYILDFGNSALIPLKKLPHTADYMTIDSTEIFQKFMELMQDEISKRKKLLAEQMVQNFEVYNQVSNKKLKAIVVAVDNFDVVKDLGFDVENFFTTLSRDGVGLGIYVIITATRTIGIKSSTMNNFKNRIAGYTFDQSEVVNIVGRSNYKPSESKGRALIKYNGSVSMMQIYSSVKFVDDVDYSKKLKEKIEEIYLLNPNEQAPRIPVLPETFTEDMMSQYEKESADIYLGLHKKTVKMYGLKRAMSPFAIVGDTAKGKTNALHLILNQLEEDAISYVFDSRALELYGFKGRKTISYIENQEQLPDFESEITQLIEQRNIQFRERIKLEESVSPKDIYNQMNSVYWIIDDIDDFIEFTKPIKGQIPQLLRDAVGVGIVLIFTGHVNKLKGFDEITKFFKSSTDGLVLSAQGMGAIFPLGASSKDQPQFMDGCLFHNGNYERIRIPKSKGGF